MTALPTNADNGHFVALVDNGVVIDVIWRLSEQRSAVGVWLPGLFWQKVRQAAEAADDKGCWPWPGTRDRAGYARFGDGRYGTVYVHLLLWRHAHGEVAEGYEVDHSCFNRACVNFVEHHRVLTLAENRKHHDPSRYTTHCPKQHPMEGDNLYVNPRTGSRACRECVREANRRHRERKASAA